MFRRTTRFILLVTLAFFAQGLSLHALAQDDGTPPSWTLVDVRLIGDEMWQRTGEVYPDFAPLGQDGVVHGLWYPLMLSPDGSTLLGMGHAYTSSGDEAMDPVLCRYVIDSRDVFCVPFDVRQIPWLSPLDAAWSPDGTRIALHEDMFHRSMYNDSDIWLLDVATLALTNMTDDGQTGNWFEVARESIDIDFAPMWSADGDLYFLRMKDMGAALVSALYRLPGGTGTPEHIIDLPGDYLTFQITDLAHAAIAPGSTADDLHIALLPLCEESPMTRGVWIIDVVAGKAEIRRVIMPFDLETGSASWTELPRDTSLLWEPMQIGWDASGAQLAVYVHSSMWLDPESEYYRPDHMNYLVIDAQTGVVTPIFDYAALSGYDALAEIEATLPGVGMLAPDRQSLIYASRSAGDPRALFASAFDTGAISTVSGALPEEIYNQMDRYNQGGTIYGYWGQSSASGRILYGNTLLTFSTKSTTSK